MLRCDMSGGLPRRRLVAESLPGSMVPREVVRRYHRRSTKRTMSSTAAAPTLPVTAPAMTGPGGAVVLPLAAGLDEPTPTPPVPFPVPVPFPAPVPESPPEPESEPEPTAPVAAEPRRAS